MTSTEQKLLEIARKKHVSEKEIGYFENHVEDYPSSWGNLYLWSIESENYELTDYILLLGFNPNNDFQVYSEIILSFGYNRRSFVNRIIQYGFIIDNEFLNEVRLTIPTSKYFDYELFNEIVLNERNKKIHKILDIIRAEVQKPFKDSG